MILENLLKFGNNFNLLGLYAELEKGFEIQVRPRSGLALKKGITC